MVTECLPRCQVAHCRKDVLRHPRCRECLIAVGPWHWETTLSEDGYCSDCVGRPKVESVRQGTTSLEPEERLELARDVLVMGLTRAAAKHSVGMSTAQRARAWLQEIGEEE